MVVNVMEKGKIGKENRRAEGIGWGKVFRL